MSTGICEVIVDLPTSLSWAELSNWLDLKSIYRMDSALCEQEKRTVFLDLLHNSECVGKVSCNRKELLVWMNKRSIKTNELFLEEDFSSEACEAYLKRFGHHIRTCNLRVFSNGVLLGIVAQYCHNLVRCQVYSLPDTSLQCSKVLKANPNLVELIICCALTSHTGINLPVLRYLSLLSKGNDDIFFVDLVKSSQQLTYMSLRNTIVTSSGMIAAAQYCPNLKYLKPPDLTDIDHTLCEMTKLCVHIQHLDLSDCTHVTDAGIIAVARNVARLRSIHFTYSPLATDACLAELARYQSNTLEVFAVYDTREPPYADSVSDGQTLSAAAVTSFRLQYQKLRVFDWHRVIVWHPLYMLLPLVYTAGMVTTLSLLHIEDAILSAIAAHCKKLELLNLYRCLTLNLCSDMMLRLVVESCNTLSRVNVCKTEVHSLLQLYADYPNVQVTSSSSCTYAYNMQSLYQEE